MMVYEDIDTSAYRKVLVVGDLHGCYDTFMKLLAKCDFNPETDLVVSVGDLIDRGTQNVECLKLLDEAWFFAVKGNHDVPPDPRPALEHPGIRPHPAVP